MKRIMMVACLMTWAQMSFSQEIQHTDPKIEALATEVYKNCTKYASGHYLQTYSEWVSRVEIREEKRNENESYPLLSEIHLKNKCNGDLQRDEVNFQKETFNPLKYAFDYETKKELIYRVNNTDFLIVIHPRK